MSGRVPALCVAGWCALALVLSAGKAQAMPVRPGDLQQAVTDIGPDVARLPGATEDTAEPFGLATTPVPGGTILLQWHGAQAGIRADQEILARCRADPATCPDAARRFLAIVAAGQAETGLARIGIINRAINMAIIPTSETSQDMSPDMAQDTAQRGGADRWRAPLETFTTGRGDCEDYAVAKYVALREAGVDEKDVKLVIVRNLAANEDHAVVAVRQDDGWIMLDNRWLTLVADVEMPRVNPRFVLDHDGVKQFWPGTRVLARRQEAAPPSLEF